MNIYQKKKEHYSLIYLLDKLDNLGTLKNGLNFFSGTTIIGISKGYGFLIHKFTVKTSSETLSKGEIDLSDFCSNISSLINLTPANIYSSDKGYVYLSDNSPGTPVYSGTTVYYYHKNTAPFYAVLTAIVKI